jgi:hypothetical protein
MKQLTTQDLVLDGQKIKLSVGGMTPTGELTISWNVPSPARAFDGIVVVLSATPPTGSPVNATKYSASTQWGTPAANGLIGSDQVVFAAYGYFGDDLSVTSVTVTGADPSTVYYATAFICSTTLQYSQKGIKSFIEDVENTPSAAPYAASIEVHAEAPSNPIDGQTYYDKADGNVYMWSASGDAWVRANADDVKVGREPPIVAGQLFANESTRQAMYFNGTAWVSVIGNARLRFGTAWIPLTGTVYVGSAPQTVVNGDLMVFDEPLQMSSPVRKTFKVLTLGGWLTVTPSLIEVMLDDWTPIPPPEEATFHGGVLPTIPTVGAFFYSVVEKALLVWTGKTWERSDVARKDEPTYEKVNDSVEYGISREENNALDNIKMRLGWPSVCVELSAGQLNFALSKALSEFRQRSDSAYEHRYISFTIKNGQQTYYLNDPRAQTDLVVDVLKVHRVSALGINSLPAEFGLYAQAFYNQIFDGPNVDLVSIHLVSQLSELFEKIFASDLMFKWNERTREITFIRNIQRDLERVVLEVTMEQANDTLLRDRMTRNWIQDWAYAEAMEMLGMIRSKYSSLGSASGSLSLNGDTLLTRATELKENLKQQLIDFEVGNSGYNVNFTGILIG